MRQTCRTRETEASSNGFASPEDTGELDKKITLGNLNLRESLPGKSVMRY
jgi:hypothetical protein